MLFYIYYKKMIRKIDYNYDKCWGMWRNQNFYLWLIGWKWLWLLWKIVYRFFKRLRLYLEYELRNFENMCL